ncbi:MAG: DNA methyltransferase [Candidatus Parabeggiatoa sp.]|nr:DNA methyltransferase [Candidatus Parabeggiatoa sp.]
MRQETFKFDECLEKKTLQPPKGYQGLSGFHKYWGKKPIEAWQFLITSLTDENDVVLDPFLGSGLVARKCLDLNRKFIGFDINPLSIELTALYLNPPSSRELRTAISEIYSSLKDEINSLYGLSNGKNASHYLWNQGELSKVWIKEGRKRIEIEPTEQDLKNIVDSISYESKYTKQPRFFDNSRINAKKSLKLSDLFSPRALRLIDLFLELSSQYDENLSRAIRMILTASVGQMSKMVFAVSKRGKTKGAVTDKIEVGSWVIGYWRPAVYFEVNAWNCFENKANKLIKALNDIDDLPPSQLAQSIPQLFHNDCNSLLQCGDSEKWLQEIPSQSIKLVLTDPPHGDRIPYLELSELWNCICSYQADYHNELVVSNAKERRKNQEKYNQKLANILAESIRVLVNNGVLAVMFNAIKKAHWNSLHTLDDSKEVVYVGCYPMEYSAGSVVQDNRIGGLKYDYVLIYIKSTNQKVSQEIVKHFCEIPGWLSEYPNKEA